MTASMAAIGLLPAALSHGIGSESQRPFAVVAITTYVALIYRSYRKAFVDKKPPPSTERQRG